MAVVLKASRNRGAAVCDLIDDSLCLVTFPLCNAQQATNAFPVGAYLIEGIALGLPSKVCLFAFCGLAAFGNLYVRHRSVPAILSADETVLVRPERHTRIR